MAAPEKPVEKAEKADQGEAATDYASRLESSLRWAVGGLGTVATTAVAKLSLDRLGKGAMDPALIAWAFAGLVAFALGVVLIISAVVWSSRASRVTISYLTSGGRVANRILRMINGSAYLLGGQADLAALRDRLTALVQKPKAFTPAEQDEFDQLIAARESVLKTAKSERARYVNVLAVLALGLGSLMATVGAATFAVATNRDEALAKEQPSPDLFPRAATPVVVSIPADDPRLSSYAETLGSECDAAEIKAIALEVASPPVDAHPPASATDVVRVVSTRTAKCNVATFWVAPDWVTVEPAEPAAADGEGDTNSSQESTKGDNRTVPEE